MIAILGSAILFVMSVIDFLVALGFPYGRFVLGGKYRIEPLSVRILCIGFILVQLFAMVIVMQTEYLIPLWFSWPITRWICLAFAVLWAVDTIVHLSSKSQSERVLMAPLCCAASVCFWATALMD